MEPGGKRSCQGSLILRYRGYPIEQLAESSSFLEVAYLLFHGELPTAEESARFSSEITHHTLLNEEMKKFFDAFPKSAHPMAILSALIGANYGSNLALFPSITKDFYGLKNFGMNYGLVFTAWGVGGFMLAKLAGAMFVKYQTFAIAYYGASALLIFAAIAVFFLKPPHHTIEAAEA